MDSAGRFTFRLLTRRDFPLLSRWLAAPHVRPWWREDPDPAAVARRYGPAVDGQDPTECHLVALDGRPFGFAQRYRLGDHPAWQRALEVTGAPTDGCGMDYLIGPAQCIGQGLGPALIAAFVHDTWVRYPEAPAVVVDVAVDNRRSWRSLEKAGFDRIWSGRLESDDPSDDGGQHVYVRHRPADHVINGSALLTPSEPKPRRR